MAKQKTLNPLTEEPTKKTEITKDFMLIYIQVKGTDKDKKWFKDKVAEYTIEKSNNLTKETVKGLDISKLRKDFIDRFFPNLNKSKGADDFFKAVENL